MLVRELTRVWRQAVSTRIAAQPKATAETFDMRKVNFAPGIVLGFGVPHAEFLQSYLGGGAGSGPYVGNPIRLRVISMRSGGGHARYALLAALFRF